MRVLVAAVIGISVLLAGAGPASAKKPNPCKVLLPSDLEPIFEQGFLKGADQIGGGCAFKRTDPEAPDIVVSLIVEQRPTVKQAKNAFSRIEEVTRELSEGVEMIPGVGDRAYYTTLIGVDVLTSRVGRNIAELRVDEPSDSEATFRDQAVALADIVEARLIPAPAPKKGNTNGNG